MEYLKVKELLKQLSNTDISYLSQKDLNGLYKVIEKALKSIEFNQEQGKILSELEKVLSNPYTVQLAKQNKISLGKSAKITPKNIESIKQKLKQIFELEQKELPKHQEILAKLKNTSEVEFLKQVQNLEKFDLELVSYLANITDSDGKLVKLGKTKASQKNNKKWFELKDKTYTTGLGLL